MSLVEYIFISLAYLGMGFLIYGFETIVMDKNTDNYELVLIILWPVSLLIGAVFQLIHFVIATFKGEI
ncbi:hypothetical protein [Holdemanella biformis]